MGNEAHRFYAVAVSDTVVGFLVQAGDFTKLEWRDGYWNSSYRPVLGLSFEDNPRQRVASSLRLPAWFSNLLPEGILRDLVAQDRGVSNQREMELLAHVGHDLPGAVKIWTLTEKPDQSWESDDFVGAEAPIPRLDAPEGFRFSLAGVGLKFSLLTAADRLTVPGKDHVGDWILKMPDVRFPHVPTNEFAIMTLARMVGIEIPEIRLIHRTELPELPLPAWPRDEDVAYAIRRFDRNGQERIHMEDFAQVRSFYPDQKYSGAFETIAALCYRGHDAASLEEFIRRFVFCFLVGNGDMHLKNWTLLYESPRQPRLSPAYDLLCTAPYAEQEGRVEDLGLKLNGSRYVGKVSRQAILRIGSLLKAHESVCNRFPDIIDSTCDLCLQHVPDVLPLMSALPDHQRWLVTELPARVQTLRRSA